MVRLPASKKDPRGWRVIRTRSYIIKVSNHYHIRGVGRRNYGSRRLEMNRIAIIKSQIIDTIRNPLRIYREKCIIIEIRIMIYKSLYFEYPLLLLVSEFRILKIYKWFTIFPPNNICIIGFKVMELVADRNGARDGGMGALISTLSLWFRANSVIFRSSRYGSITFRCSPCGFARIPVSRGLFRPLLGGAT